MHCAKNLEVFNTLTKMKIIYLFSFLITIIPMKFSQVIDTTIYPDPDSTTDNPTTTISYTTDETTILNDKLNYNYERTVFDHLENILKNAPCESDEDCEANEECIEIIQYKLNPNATDVIEEDIKSFAPVDNNLNKGLLFNAPPRNKTLYLTHNNANKFDHEGNNMTGLLVIAEDQQDGYYEIDDYGYDDDQHPDVDFFLRGCKEVKRCRHACNRVSKAICMEFNCKKLKSAFRKSCSQTCYDAFSDSSKGGDGSSKQDKDDDDDYYHFGFAYVPVQPVVPVQPAWALWG